MPPPHENHGKTSISFRIASKICALPLALPKLLRANPLSRSGRRTAMKSPTYVSLYSGCGGFDLGFEQSGFRGLGAFEIDADAVTVYRQNFRGECHVADLQFAKVTPEEFGSPDVVISGSPCQGFSTLGKRNATDPRNSLLQRGARLAIGLRPKVIVLENVCGVLSSTLKQHWDGAVTMLEDAGYKTVTHRVTCSDFGVPPDSSTCVLDWCPGKRSGNGRVPTAYISNAWKLLERRR